MYFKCMAQRYEREEREARLRREVYAEFEAGRLTTPSAVVSMERYISRRLSCGADAARTFLVETLGLDKF